MNWSLSIVDDYLYLFVNNCGRAGCQGLGAMRLAPGCMHGQSQVGHLAAQTGHTNGGKQLGNRIGGTVQRIVFIEMY